MTAEANSFSPQENRNSTQRRASPMSPVAAMTAVPASAVSALAEIVKCTLLSVLNAAPRPKCLSSLLMADQYTAATALPAVKKKKPEFFRFFYTFFLLP